jgi:hypothetical protein
MEDRSKDKHIHKYKHDYTQTQIQNMWNYSMEFGERGKGRGMIEH